MPGLEAIDVVATEALLESGYSPAAAREPAARASRTSRLERPAVAAHRCWSSRMSTAGRRARSASFVCRDREEELAEFVRALKSRRARTPLGRTAIVFQRPLPYLYLARQVFARRAGAVPGARLAAARRGAVRRGGRSRVQRDRGGLHARRAGRAAALARTSRSSPTVAVADAADVHALDRYLVEQKYLGDAERLPACRRRSRATGRRVAALAAAAAAARGADGRGAAPTRAGADRRHPRVHRVARAAPAAADAWFARHLRARAAVLGRAADAARRARRARSGARCRSRSCPARCGAGSTAQTFSPRLGDDGRHAARRQRGAVRRRRRDPHRRPVRGGLAGAQHAQHLLSAVAARPARLAGRAGPLPGRARAVPGSAAAAAPPRLALVVHARGRRDRVAVAAARGRRRRGPADRAAGHRPPARRGPRACSCTRRWRSIRSRRRSCAARRRSGWRCAPSRTLRRRRASAARPAPRAVRPMPSAGWSATSSARSSTSPRTSSSCPRSATNRRG